MPHPSHFTPGKDLVPIVLEPGCAPGPVQTGAENLAPPGFDPWTIQPVASHYTKWAILAPNVTWHMKFNGDHIVYEVSWAGSMLLTSLDSSYCTSCLQIINVWKGKAIPLEAWTGCYSWRWLRLAERLGSLHMKVVRLSALRTGHLYPPGDIRGTHSCWPQLCSAAGRIK